MNADVETFAQDVTMSEIYGYERSFHSDVETFVVWVVPQNSGENWSTCSGLRETLFFGSRYIFSQSQVTCKVKRCLTLTFRNHKYKTTRKIQDDQLTNIARNGRFGFQAVLMSVLMSVHEKNNEICGS